jgi:catechol 2,3-dioxygenase-like lactoylglutathione lyase family enzyme
LKADHFAFQVSDLERAIDFYTNRLGLKLLFHTVDEDHHEAFAFLELEGGNLELLQILDEENQPAIFERSELKPPYCPHLAMQTDDLDSWAQRFREQNLAIVKGPLEIRGKVKWMYIHDPDHNILEFVEWM